jgi:hypothetical protein
LKEVVAPLEEGRKKPIVINDTRWVNLPKIIIDIFKNNNDHGVDVSIIIVLLLKHIENNDILNHSHEIHL